ncbi:MAG: RNase adapter RapZ [Bacillota bacterium]|jgi:UPF0042 nucleotide-binding protein
MREKHPQNNHPQDSHFIIITGLSGAGKSLAMKTLEDVGYFCVDNLPPVLIPKFAELCLQAAGRINKLAIVVDLRGGDFFNDINDALAALDDSDLKYEIVFLDASDEALVRRYKESRRRHPVSPGGGLLESIQNERVKLQDLKSRATYLVDTTTLDSKMLRERILSIAGIRAKERLQITIISFGFKFGVPMDVDLVFDVRFLPNPYYVEDLRALTGKDDAVAKYVMNMPSTKGFLNRVTDLLNFSLPLYAAEGKSKLIIGIGCTGGRHRSVAIAEKLGDYISDKGYQVQVEHRDIRQ